MVQVDPQDMTHVLDEPFVEDVVPIEPRPEYGFVEDNDLFFEAFSLRKVGSTYYLIYSPKRGCRLANATSDKPMGPYTYKGWIVDNGVDYPGGNDHGSICRIGDQWYIFYHRMTNATLTSRRACVEKIEILPDGTIPAVEMTSLGFQDALDPYQPTPADIACVLKGKGFITERNVFDRVITGIEAGTVMGWKYFDFGEDRSSCTMLFAAKARGFGADCDVHILADAEDGEEIGCFHVGPDGGVVETTVKALTGRHAIFLRVTTAYDGWMADWFKGRCLMELQEFVFMK